MRCDEVDNHLWKKKRLTKSDKTAVILVKPILTYNLKACSFKKKGKEELDSFHRRQLKRVLGIRWPHRISSRNLYKKINTKPLSIEIIEA